MVLLVFFPLLPSCTTDVEDRDKNTNPVFATLEKVDDYPLYVWRYDGDYDLTVSPPVLENLNNPGKKSAWACTCFSTLNDKGNIMLGRNFDWYDHPALLLFTRPGGAYASVSMVDISYLGYGKTENVLEKPEGLLNAPLLPFDGMNEHGLAIGMMALSSAEAPVGPGKETVDSLLLIRLILDYAKNIDEAVSIIGQYNVDWGEGPPLHYFITDKSKRSVIVEFVNHKINVISNEYPWQVSTNFVLTGLTRNQCLSSCWRYRTAWNFLKQKNGMLTQDETMELLHEVSQSNTVWSILYNTTTLDIRVVMDRKYNQVYNFSLQQ